MSVMRSIPLIALCLTVAACGTPSSEFREALPEVDGVTLELTGDATEGAAEPLRTSPVGVSTSAVATTSEYLRHARDGVRLVNGTVRELFGQVREITQSFEGERVRDGTVMYGPQDRGNVTFRLFVRRVARNAWGWRLDAKPLGAEDSAYVRVMGGAVQQREDGTRRGSFGANLDNLKSVDESTPGQGVLLAGFGVRDGNKTLAFRLNAFTPDTAEHAPVTAAFTGHRLAETGRTHVKLAHRASLSELPDGTDAEELLRLRARWVPGVGGRAAMVATGGDIPEGEGYVGLACWDGNLEEGYKIIRHCTGIATGARSCEVVREAGDPANCRSEVREVEEPALDPLDDALDEDAPDLEVSAPETEPTGGIEG